MSDALSGNTQAILLLTAPLILGRGSPSAPVLTAGEYNRLALQLRERKWQPADLLGALAEEVIAACGTVVEEERLRRLLDRGFQLSQALERWRSRALWVISRADPTYPRRLKARLNGAAPAVLYGCGPTGLLESGGLAVVGSRDVDEALIEYTASVGRLAARARQTIVSGGARGVDLAAMRAALAAGGRAIGVLADSLEKAAMNRENRTVLLEEKLVLVTPYDPSAGFNVGHAMQRNKLIYALAEAALVVNAELNKGGTWAGATEQLDKLRFVPVYVRSTGGVPPGLEALAARGARAWPNPTNETELSDALRAAPSAGPSQGQSVLALESPATNAEPRAERATEAPSDPATELFDKVREIVVRLLRQPKDGSDLCAELGITASQADEWLRRLVSERQIEQRGSTSYVVASPSHVREAGAMLPGATSAEGHVMGSDGEALHFLVRDTKSNKAIDTLEADVRDARGSMPER